MNVKETQKAGWIPTLTDTEQSQCVHIPNLRICYNLISFIDNQRFVYYVLQAKNFKMPLL